MSFVLTTERLRLRRLTEDDLDVMAEMLGNSEVMAHYPRPKSRSEAADWINWNISLYAQHGFGLWAVERISDGAFIGDCGLTPQVVDDQLEIEVGYHVRREFWGNGYASEAATACVAYARDELGVQRVVAIMVPGNTASRRTAEKAGLSFDRMGDYKGTQAVVMSVNVAPLPN